MPQTVAEAQAVCGGACLFERAKFRTPKESAYLVMRPTLSDRRMLSLIRSVGSLMCSVLSPAAQSYRLHRQAWGREIKCFVCYKSEGWSAVVLNKTTKLQFDFFVLPYPFSV